MAVVEEQKESSSFPQPKLERVRPPENEDKANVVSANPMKSERHKPKRCKKTKVESLYDTFQVQCSVLERANEVAASLAPEFPSLVKVMMPSHVTRVFWLGLPRAFCCEHMPKHDTMIVLEDESGEEYQTKYLAGKDGLSGGWRGFSVVHKLLEGDVVVFHLVTPSKFKVYIVRSNGSAEVDCTLGLIKLDAGIRQIKTGKLFQTFKIHQVILLNGLTIIDPLNHFTILDHAAEVTTCESSENGKLEPISVEILHENVQKENTIACNTKFGPISDQSENDSEDIDSEDLDGIMVSESVILFNEVRCIKNFNITVSGLIINAEISKHHLTKYYELCCSQNSFLHDQLVGLNCKLVAGIISETINIADAIRACKISTSECNFSTWSKTLEASEMLGMNVGFLRARLEQLASLASESKLCIEAIFARDQAVKDMRTLEAKLLKAKEIINRLGFEIVTLNTRSKKLEAMFKEVAKAPW